MCSTCQWLSVSHTCLQSIRDTLHAEGGMNMTNSDSGLFGRREMARSALLGGASLLLGAQATARAQGPSAGQAARSMCASFGATGDGKTDDTKAIQRALDAAGEVRGTVFVPAGVYLCADLQMRPNTALVGVPTWDYGGAGGTVLRLASGAAKCLLNIAGGPGRHDRWPGASMARDLGKGMHGIFLDKPDYGKHEDAFRIERCQVARFTGDGVSLAHAWCFSVRHSMLALQQRRRSALARLGRVPERQLVFRKPARGFRRAQRKCLRHLHLQSRGMEWRGEYSDHRRRRLPDYREFL